MVDTTSKTELIRLLRQRYADLGDTLARKAADMLESPDETFARQPSDCKHERASIKCPDCGIDFIGTVRLPRVRDLCGELRRYFDSGTLDEASDLYLLLKEVEAMQPEEPSPPPACTCTPPKFESNERHGTFTSGRIDPNCPIHWRQTLIQNSSPEKASGEPNKLVTPSQGAWYCGYSPCRQLNSAWANTCGRCGHNRPEY